MPKPAKPRSRVCWPSGKSLAVFTVPIGSAAMPRPNAWSSARSPVTRAAQRAREVGFVEIEPDAIMAERERVFAALNRKDGIQAHGLKEQIQNLMMEYVGPLRSGQGLQEAIRAFAEIKENAGPHLDPGKIQAHELRMDGSP